MKKQMRAVLSSTILALSLWAVAPALGQPVSAYFQAVTNLNPVGYWPMHEVAAPAPGDVEANLGTLGPLANGYYVDWIPMTPRTTHGVSGALVGDADTAASFNGVKNGGGQGYLLVPRTLPQVGIQPPPL